MTPTSASQPAATVQHVDWNPLGARPSRPLRLEFPDVPARDFPSFGTLLVRRPSPLAPSRSAKP